MVLELHIWGPAFDLPSIDARCLAAVAYLRKCLPSDAWVLVPCSDPRVSPYRELPALRDGEVWVAGFPNIVAYLEHISDGAWDLDRDFDDGQRATRAAFSSFLESRGQPLLDLSLYVSSDNYTASTRHALSHILTWPDSWTVPHRLRAEAKSRSEHLGLSSLDVDAAQEDSSNNSLTAHIPQSLRKPKQTVSGLLGRNTQKNRFRLDAVTSDFLEPLGELLGDEGHFLGDSDSSLDCLAVGYLALAQIPQLPHGWVRETLQTKYANLDRWATAQRTRSFGPPADVATALGGESPSLPWRDPPTRNLQQLVQSVLDGCISSMPVVASGFVVSEMGCQQVINERGQFKPKQMQLARLQHRRDMYVQIVTSTCAVTGLFGWLWYKGMLSLPHRVHPPKGRSFGEAGALLGLA